MRIIGWAMLWFLAITSPAVAQVKSIEMSFEDGARRSVPVTIVAKPGAAKGLILFSHGALSSPEKYSAMTMVWAKNGYVVVAPLHGDSSDWHGPKPTREQQLGWRMADMRVASDHVPALAKAAGVRVGKVPTFMAGHSFGGLIAMNFDPERAAGVIAFSPPGPLPGLPAPLVTKPLLTFTGTADSLPMVAPKWEDHLAAHRAATGGASAWIGEGVDHYFGGVFGRLELPGPKQQTEFDEAMRLTLIFLKRPAKPGFGNVRIGRIETR